MHQAFTLNLKPGAFEAYKAHHDSIPTAHADLAEAISKSGVKALRIFARGNTLFLCVEATDDQAMQRLWASRSINSGRSSWSHLSKSMTTGSLKPLSSTRSGSSEVRPTEPVGALPLAGATTPPQQAEPARGWPSPRCGTLPTCRGRRLGEGNETATQREESVVGHLRLRADDERSRRARLLPQRLHHARGVVPDEVNARVMAYCDQYAGARGEITVGEPWYVSAVTLNPAVTGVVRSLLGRDFAYLDRAATHRSEGAQPEQRWHRDGGAVHGPRVDCLQVFYLPRRPRSIWGRRRCCPARTTSSSTPVHGPLLQDPGAVLAAAPAARSSSRTMRSGTGARRSTSPQVRNLLKFWYLRTTPPRRDWVRCDDFTLEQAFHLPGGNSFGREGHLVRNQAVEMMYWLPASTTSSARLCRVRTCPCTTSGTALGRRRADHAG